MVLVAVPPVPPAPAALQSLLTAEHAFARHAREQGTGQAFVKVYHPEGLIFRPRPEPGGAFYAKQPDDGSRLLWGPAAAWVAKGGDLGFTTGPWTWHPKVDDPSQAQGWFVSVWVREENEPWRLFWDLGTSNPAEPKATPLLPDAGRPPSGTAAAPDIKAAAALLDVDRAFGRDATVSGPKRAYSRIASRDLRLHRKGIFPAVGLPNSLDLIQAMGAHSAWNPEAARVASSGDLGCTRGTLLEGTTEKGAYVRLWRKEGVTWKLLLDVEVPY